MILQLIKQRDLYKLQLLYTLTHNTKGSNKISDESEHGAPVRLSMAQRTE